MFLEQKAEGFSVWQQPMIQLRLPILYNLKSDPFERAQHESGDYVRWFIEHAFVVVPAQAIVASTLRVSCNFRRGKDQVRFRSNRRWKSCDYRRPIISRGRLSSWPTFALLPEQSSTWRLFLQSFAGACLGLKLVT